MLRQGIIILFILPHLTFSQTSDLPFQVLVAENALIYGKEIAPLTYVDDVTSIDVKPGGFLALVHKGGTTYELNEKIFTFYLKPEELKEQATRPALQMLYNDSSAQDATKEITVIHPKFDESGSVTWEANTPFEMYWHLPDEPVITYKVSVADHTGKKIQDFGTKYNRYVLKPYNFGLDESEFIFKITSTFAGETISSMDYKIKLESGPTYPVKASDLVLKAMNLELSPTEALKVWKEIMAMENGKYYGELFGKFLLRNKSVLSSSGQDVDTLLSQNK